MFSLESDYGCPTAAWKAEDSKRDYIRPALSPTSIRVEKFTDELLNTLNETTEAFLGGWFQSGSNKSKGSKCAKVPAELS